MQPLHGLFEQPRGSIPELPVLLPRLMQLPDAAPRRDVLAILREDAELCEAVLSIAATPYYSGRRPLDRLSRLVDRVGLPGVRGLVLQAALDRAVFGRPGSAIGRLWDHSLATAYITRAICQHAAVHSETAFAAALLQHTGLAVPLGLSEVTDSELWQRLGCAHEAIAGFLAESWSLPEPLCTVLLRHHQLGASPASDQIVATLVLADLIARALGRGLEPWVHAPPQDSEIDAALAHLDLSAGRLPLIERAADAVLLRAAA